MTDFGKLSGNGEITMNNVTVRISCGGSGGALQDIDVRAIMDEVQARLLKQAERDRKWDAMTEEQRDEATGKALDKMAHDPPMRAVYMRHLESSLERYWAVVRDPGPRLWKGEPVIDPQTGEPVPDYGKAVDAIREATGVLEKMARLCRPEPGEAG